MTGARPTAGEEPDHRRVLYTADVVRAREEGTEPMGDRPRRHDEIKGATVLLTGWSEGREREVADALGKISTRQVELDQLELPFVALPKTSLEKAEAARDLLLEAGGSVDLEDAWVTRDAPRPVASRPVCPFCGSTKTQPYTHAGPAARTSMKCTTCGQRFRVTATH